MALLYLRCRDGCAPPEGGLKVSTITGGDDGGGLSGGVAIRDPPPVLKRIMLAMTPSPEKHMMTVTMGDPAEVVATTPVVGTAMMTAMVMMTTIMAMMVMMRRDGDAAVEGNTCEYYISSKPKAFRLQEGSS